MEKSSQPVGALIGLIGGSAVVVGSIGTWAKIDAGFLARSVSGMDGDGKITVFLGALVALMALLQLLSSGSRIGVVVGALAALAAGGVGVYDAVNVNERANEVQDSYDFVSAGVGWGLYLVIGGSAIALVGLLVALNQTTASAATARACPHCAESIQPAAAVCRFCGRDVQPLVI